MEYILRGGAQANHELLEDAAMFGVAIPEHIKKPDNFVLWDTHLPVLDLFLRCLTQWRAGPSGLIGLDYGVVMQMAALHNVEELPRVMEDLQVMEIHARDMLNKEAQRQG